MNTVGWAVKTVLKGLLLLVVALLLAFLTIVGLGVINAHADTLTWTTPGDDGMVGQIVAPGHSELRYASDSTQIATGTLVPTGPPKAPGEPDSVTFTPAFTGWASVRYWDDAGNVAPWGNFAHVVAPAPPDTTPPAPITDLRVISVSP